MSNLSSSVLIASTRPLALARCLESLAAQITPADEVIVAWQGEDIRTWDVATATAMRLGLPLHLVHSPALGVVPAENAALEQAVGDVILLIDDDAVAPPDWIARHLAHYRNPQVGAVGGPFTNHGSDGLPFPKRSVEPVGRLTWFGKAVGNVFDHPETWRSRGVIEVDHLAGGNMTFRRVALKQFEPRLKRYWQFFEMEACLQVRAGGYRVLFDFANVVDHYPTSTTFVAGRVGDLTVKVYNAAYNQAFVLSKHLAGWRRFACLSYLLGVGSSAVPGLCGCLFGMARHGRPWREARICARTLQASWRGWRDGSGARTLSAVPSREARLSSSVERGIGDVHCV